MFHFLYDAAWQVKYEVVNHHHLDSNFLMQIVPRSQDHVNARILFLVRQSPNKKRFFYFFSWLHKIFLLALELHDYLGGGNYC